MTEQASSIAVLYSLWLIYLPSHNSEVLNFPPDAREFHNPMSLRISHFYLELLPALFIWSTMCQPQ